MSDPTDAPTPAQLCKDCGQPFWIDTVLPDAEWERLCPEHGLLCANCIVERASKLPHTIIVYARIVSADDHDAFAALKNVPLASLVRADAAASRAPSQPDAAQLWHDDFCARVLKQILEDGDLLTSEETADIMETVQREMLEEDRLAAGARAVPSVQELRNVDDDQPSAGLITGCCGRWIEAHDRFCPQCGHECRVRRETKGPIEQMIDEGSIGTGPFRPAVPVQDALTTLAPWLKHNSTGALCCADACFCGLTAKLATLRREAAGL